MLKDLEEYYKNMIEELERELESFDEPKFNKLLETSEYYLDYFRVRCHEPNEYYVTADLTVKEEDEEGEWWFCWGEFGVKPNGEHRGYHSFVDEETSDKDKVVFEGSLEECYKYIEKQKGSDVLNE